MPSILDRRLPRPIDNPRAWRNSLLSYLLTRLRRSAAAFAAGFSVRCAVNHLRSLDDDRLRDLGLTREDIEHFVRFGRD